MRHFLFLLPVIAVTAALVADDVLIRLEEFPYRWTIYMPLAAYCTMHLSITTMLHPNQYVYYNAFVGGVEGAQRKFNLNYRANSHPEAVQGLEDYLRAQYGLGFVEREFTVAVCGPPYSRAKPSRRSLGTTSGEFYIQEFGFTNPMLVDGENGVVAGHARLTAAQKLGLADVPTIDLSWLSSAQRQAYVIADNRLAEDAGWDHEMLRLELGDLEGLGPLPHRLR